MTVLPLCVVKALFCRPVKLNELLVTRKLFGERLGLHLGGLLFCGQKVDLVNGLIKMVKFV